MAIHLGQSNYERLSKDEFNSLEHWFDDEIIKNNSNILSKELNIADKEKKYILRPSKLNTQDSILYLILNLDYVPNINNICEELKITEPRAQLELDALLEKDLINSEYDNEEYLDYYRIQPAGRKHLDSLGLLT